MLITQQHCYCVISSYMLIELCVDYQIIWLLPQPYNNWFIVVMSWVMNPEENQLFILAFRPWTQVKWVKIKSEAVISLKTLLYYKDYTTHILVMLKQITAGLFKMIRNTLPVIVKLVWSVFLWFWMLSSLTSFTIFPGPTLAILYPAGLLNSLQQPLNVWLGTCQHGLWLLWARYVLTDLLAAGMDKGLTCNSLCLNGI